MTPDQLRAFADEVVCKAFAARDTQTDEETAPGTRYVYGLRGIRELFNVSHVTAQRYKDSFLAPAVMQRGRKIIVDVNKAMKLYSEQKQ